MNRSHRVKVKRPRPSEAWTGTRFVIWPGQPPAEAGLISLRAFGTAEAVPFPVKFKIEVDVKVNGDGQECPSHTGVAALR